MNFLTGRLFWANNQDAPPQEVVDTQLGDHDPGLLRLILDALSLAHRRDLPHHCGLGRNHLDRGDVEDLMGEKLWIRVRDHC